MYIGRFAPSPTGPLHFGSLVAALVSFLDARRHQGAWYVRMEDVDGLREVPGAADAILRALTVYGLQWDGSVLYQSQRLDAYAEALAQLQQRGLAYACGCSRREIAAQARQGAEGLIYPGWCRHGVKAGKLGRAIRVRTEDAPVRFRDRLQGEVVQCVSHEVGDFVLRRADGLFAYQLAVVVDDAYQGITHVVRGLDLLYNTPRQRYLQALLGYATPQYLHHPLVLGNDERKLSKQHRAPALCLEQPVPQLCQALGFLGYRLPREAADMNPPTLLAWALTQADPLFDGQPEYDFRISPGAGQSRR